jgi:hypothetical protein
MHTRGFSLLGTTLISVFLNTAPFAASDPPSSIQNAKKPDLSPVVRTFEAPVIAGQTAEEAGKAAQKAFDKQMQEDQKTGYAVAILYDSSKPMPSENMVVEEIIQAAHDVNAGKKLFITKIDLNDDPSFKSVIKEHTGHIGVYIFSTFKSNPLNVRLIDPLSKNSVSLFIQEHIDFLDPPPKPAGDVAPVP